MKKIIIGESVVDELIPNIRDESIFYRKMLECALACQGDEGHPLDFPPLVEGVREGGSMTICSPQGRRSPVKTEEKYECPAAHRGEINYISS